MVIVEFVPRERIVRFKDIYFFVETSNENCFSHRRMIKKRGI